MAADGSQVIEEGIADMPPLFLTCDAQGRLTGISMGGLGWTSHYNNFNEPTLVTLNGVPVFEMSYSALGGPLG